MSYKFSHYKQYPPKTTGMFSYLESRGGKYPYTLFFGLQYILKKYFYDPITVDQVEEAKVFCEKHGVPFNFEGWYYIATELNGKLPVRIRAVQEGTILPVSNILMSIESTDPKVFWLANYIETAMVRLWYYLTVATLSYECKQLIKGYLEVTCDNPEQELPFKLHDFGSRGVSCQEQAMIGGAAHLINFLGSDTVAGIWMANEYYGAGMAGFSISASEHSTMTMWGKDHEADAMENMIDQYGDQPLFACVSDSYDIYNAIDNIWGNKLKSKIENMKAMLIIRPDSGHPVEVPVECVERLAAKFGTTTNNKGFKVLKNVRVIQGDGINKDDIDQILFKLKDQGFSAENMAFGMGGALLQRDINRDTNKFAFKCSWAMVDGKEVDVYKDPVGDKGKKSKKGRLDLVDVDGCVRTVREGTGRVSLLSTVYENGKIVREQTFDDIRQRAAAGPLKQHTGWIEKE